MIFYENLTDCRKPYALGLCITHNIRQNFVSEYRGQPWVIYVFLFLDFIMPITFASSFFFFFRDVSDTNELDFQRQCLML